MISLPRDVRETVGENVRGQLANTKLTDLFSVPRQLGEVPLKTLTNEPVLFEPFGVHAFAVVKNSDCGTLVVEVGWKEDGDALGSCIERIGDQFLDRFVRASVQTFGKQTNDPKAQPNINLFGFDAGSCKIRTGYHV